MNLFPSMFSTAAWEGSEDRLALAGTSQRGRRELPILDVRAGGVEHRMRA